MKRRTLVEMPGVSLMDIDRWTRTGLLRLDLPGSGQRRTYPPEEVRAALALQSLRQLGGVSSQDGVNVPPAAHALRHTLADLARSHPAGSAHEITTPVPWIKHVLIVPNP